jgi:hypothetical protein
LAFFHIWALIEISLVGPNLHVKPDKNGSHNRTLYERLILLLPTVDRFHTKIGILKKSLILQVA